MGDLSYESVTYDIARTTRDSFGSFSSVTIWYSKYCRVQSSSKATKNGTLQFHRRFDCHSVSFVNQVEHSRSARDGGR
jgi:hypothetical protein